MNQKYKNAADAVIGFLERRRGFDGWWGDIDEEVSTEILDGLAETIRKEIEHETKA